MADIAVIFHWPPATMDAMPIHELLEWRNLAVERHNQINQSDGGG
jgi:hypothetical protein